MSSNSMKESEPPGLRRSERARRYRRDLLAGVYSTAKEPPEVAVVRDISESGLRVRLDASARFDVVRTRNPWIELRLPGAPFVRCAVTFVRVAEHRPDGVELAFALSDEAQRDPALQALLARLREEA
jgi:hypothetical protein